MITPYKPQNKIINTQDLEPLYDFISSLKFYGDGINIVVDHNQAGVSIRYIGESTAKSSKPAATSIYPCIVTSVTSTAVYGVKLSSPTAEPFLIAPLSYQDTNLSVGNVIMATEYIAITL